MEDTDKTTAPKRRARTLRPLHVAALVKDKSGTVLKDVVVEPLVASREIEDVIDAQDSTPGAVRLKLDPTPKTSA